MDRLVLGTLKMDTWQSLTVGVTRRPRPFQFCRSGRTPGTVVNSITIHTQPSVPLPGEGAGYRGSP